ncbi:MAG: response regulator [Candidatus Heimdallarchaeaceae archaeon]
MEKVMIVDDNDDLRSLFHLMLKTHYEIVEAGNGLEAISVFKEHKPALTLMDIVMPEMNGIEATRKIRKISPEAKIIAITAHSTGIQDILDAGAFLVRQKPIRRKDLLELVKNSILRN